MLAPFSFSGMSLVTPNCYDNEREYVFPTVMLYSLTSSASTLNVISSGAGSFSNNQHKLL